MTTFPVSPLLRPAKQSLPSSVKRPFVRLAQFEDYDQIAAVEARQGLTVKPQEQWLDLWLDNPAYLELRDWPIGWVVDDGEGRIVGSLGNIPGFCRFGGKTFVCASGRGWAVDVQYRSLSVILLAHQLRQGRTDINLITTPGPITAALCTRLGWSRVPVGEWDRSEFWITDYAGVVQGYLEANTPKVISTLARTMISPSRRLESALLRRPSTPPSEYQLEWSTTFDERFDHLWEDLMQQRPNLLLGSRSAETLRWHFKHALREERIWILTASKNSRLAGYAILERRDIQGLNLTRVLFIDFQTLSRDADLCSAMVQFALNRCRREGIHVLENAGCWLDKLQPIQPPPHRRSLETWCYLYRVTNPELERNLRDAASWYPTQYDGDASL